MVNQHPFENSHYKLLRNIVNQISDIDHWMPESVSIGIPYIMTGDFDSTNLIKYDTAKKISNDDYLKLSKRIKPEYGDIIETKKPEKSRQKAAGCRNTQEVIYTQPLFITPFYLLKGYRSDRLDINIPVIPKAARRDGFTR